MGPKDTDNRPEMAETKLSGEGRKPETKGSGVFNLTAARDEADPSINQLMEAVVSRENLRAAYRRVKSNKGSAGVDRMSLAELGPYLRDNWAAIKVSLLEGRYEPAPVGRVDIPKPGGKGMRTLGVPTVLDRLIQQAIHQVIQPIFDPSFSTSSFGFRPGRSAHWALKQISATAIDGWWTWTWRSFSTRSTMTS